MYLRFPQTLCGKQPKTMGVEGLDESDKTHTNTLFEILPEAECEAIARDATLRELVRLWSTLDIGVQQAIIAIVRSSAR